MHRKPSGSERDPNRPLLGTDDEDTAPRRSAEALKELIVRTIEPGTWVGGDFRITVHGGGKLVVVHTPSVQAKVARFLDDLR